MYIFGGKIYNLSTIIFKKSKKNFVSWMDLETCNYYYYYECYIWRTLQKRRILIHKKYKKIYLFIKRITIIILFNDHKIKWYIFEVKEKIK